MEKLKEKMSILHKKIDEATCEADTYKNKCKDLEQETLTKEQEIKSLTHRNEVLEQQLERLEGNLKAAQFSADQDDTNSSRVESLERKVKLLETEADETDKNMREITEKLRQTDVKAEHFERKVATVEAERDQWEKKYEELQEKHKKLAQEFEALSAEIEGL